MKTLLNFSIFSLLVFALSFCQCKQPGGGGDQGCTDPIATYPFPKNASKWLMQPIVPGDSIKFLVYHRDNRSSPYIYRREEDFYIKDTMLKKVEIPNTFFDLNCNAWMYATYLNAYITGPESLGCELTNDATTVLQIYLRGKNFSVGADQYQSHQADWFDTLAIGGKTYYQVNMFAGVDPSTYHYVDSTYCFYNQQYGMLKIIVNDTLIYQRILH